MTEIYVKDDFGWFSGLNLLSTSRTSWEQIFGAQDMWNISSLVRKCNIVYFSKDVWLQSQHTPSAQQCPQTFLAILRDSLCIHFLEQASE